MSKDQPEEKSTYRYKFDNVEFDESSMELRVDGKVVSLEQRPKVLLSSLLAHVNEVLTKNELLNAVWPGQVTVENVLANAVAKLRKALPTASAERIITHPRIGYRFAGPIERIVVGRHIKSPFEFTVGDRVLGRENFLLEKRLSSASGREVWLARHDKTNEPRVFKFAADGLALETIKREATIFRLLNASLKDNRCFTQVFDWNFTQPPFFIESEFVGDDLLSWATKDAQLSLLSLDERIKLIISIIDAVCAIHSVGILHKDIKPANIILRLPIDDHDSHIVLADFGSGSLLSHSLLNLHGITPDGISSDETNDSPAGSHAYLAPELVKGQSPSTRSDVYALGVVAYQILKGDINISVTPNSAESIKDPLLREDIALATAENPDDRHATAEAFADRLRSIDERRKQAARALEETKELAAARRALMRVQARRPWVITASLLLVLGIVTSSIFGINANIAQQSAEKESQRAEAANEFLRELIVSADPRALGSESQSSIRDSLERAFGLVEKRFSFDNDTQLVMLQTLADVFSGVSDFSSEIEARERVVELYREKNGAHHEKTISAQLKLTDALIRNSRIDQAENELAGIERSSVATLQRHTELNILAKMIRGRIHLQRLELDPAINYLEQAENLFQVSNVTNVETLILIRHDLAQSLSRLGQEERAIKIFSKLHELVEDNSATIPPWRRADIYLSHASALVFAFRTLEAIPILHQALEIRGNVFGKESREVGQVHALLGNAHSSVGHWEPALDSLSKARQIICSTHRDSHVECISMLSNEGVALLELGNYLVAEQQLHRAKELLNPYGDEHPAIQVINYHLARTQIEKGELGNIPSLLQSLSQTAMESSAPGNHWQVRIDGLKGRYLIRAGNFTEGRSLLMAAVEKMKSLEFPASFIEPYISDLERNS